VELDIGGKSDLEKHGFLSRLFEIFAKDFYFDESGRFGTTKRMRKTLGKKVLIRPNICASLGRAWQQAIDGMRQAGRKTPGENIVRTKIT
jgi:hypothetical protein